MPHSDHLGWRVFFMPVKMQVMGVQHGRDFGRALSRRRLCGLFGFVFSIGISRPANAIPPLMVAADIASPELEGFWKEGDFVVGMPHVKGNPGIKPLQGHKPVQFPADLSTWTAVGETCQKEPKGVGQFGGSPIHALVAGDPMHPKIQLWMSNRPVAEALLGRPASVCSIHIGNADGIPGPEIITTWRTEAPNPTRGFTVFRVPEALDPTPVRSPN